MVEYSENVKELCNYVRDIDKYNIKNACKFSIAFNEKLNEGTLTIGFIKIMKGRDNIEFVDYKISKGDLLNGN